MSAALRFMLEGSLTSNNHVKTPIGFGRSIKTQGAKHDQNRVFQLAFVAAHAIGWIVPPAAAITVNAYNTRKDVGNIEKVIADGLEGIAFENDRYQNGLHVEKFVDWNGERYEVIVQPRERLVRGPKPKKARAA